MSHDCGEATAELIAAQQKGNQKFQKAPSPLYVWRCTYVCMYVERMTCTYGHKPYGQPCSVWLRIYGFEIAPFCSNPVRCQVLGNAQKKKRIYQLHFFLNKDTVYKDIRVKFSSNLRTS